MSDRETTATQSELSCSSDRSVNARQRRIHHHLGLKVIGYSIATAILTLIFTYLARDIDPDVLRIFTLFGYGIALFGVLTVCCVFVFVSRVFKTDT